MFDKEITFRNGIPIEKGVVLTKDYLDNNAPIIKFTSHAQKAQVYGSGLVTVRGNADDVKDLYLKVTSSASVPSVADLSTWQKIDEYTSGAAWAIEFDGVSPSNVVGSS